VIPNPSAAIPPVVPMPPPAASVPASVSPVIQPPTPMAPPPAAPMPQPAQGSAHPPAVGHAPPAYQSAPPPPRPARVEASITGSLTDSGIAKVLMDLERKKVSGRLNLTSNQVSNVVYLRRGGVMRVEEDPEVPEHFLGEILNATIQLNPRDRDEALQAAQERGLLLGQELIRRKLINHRDLREALGQQIEARVIAQTKLQEGQFAFYERVGPGKVPPAPNISPVSVILRERINTLRMRLPDEMTKLEQPFLESYCFKGEQAPDDMGELGLSQDEVKFWDQVITGRYHLRKVYTLSNLSRRQTHALIFTLHNIGVLKFRPEMATEFRLQNLAEFYQRKFRRIEADDLFQVLELHWMATEEEVRRNHERLHKMYDYSSLPSELPPKLKEKADAIMARLEEARRRLSAHSDRQRYRHDIIEDHQLHFTADLLGQQGDMAVFRADYKEAIDRFIHVLEIDPKNLDARRKLDTLRTQGIS